MDYYILLIFGVFVGAHCNELVTLEPEFHIKPSNLSGNKSIHGIVYGARQCGGSGKFVQWRLEGCNTTNSTCHFTVDDRPRQCEVDFIPSENIDQLGFRLFEIFEDGVLHNVFEKPLEHSSVDGGVQHMFTMFGQANKNLKGKKVTTRIVLFRLDKDDIELCVDGDFELI